MFILPPGQFVEQLAATIEGASFQSKKSCFDNPVLAAVHLKSREDLEMFYEGTAPGEWQATTAAATYVFQAAVAVGATAVAFAHNGLSHNATDPLHTLPSEVSMNLHLEEMLEMRAQALQAI